MRRFIIDNPDMSVGHVRLSGPEAHHAANVLRLKIDDTVILVDGQGREFTAQVASIRRGAVDLDIIEQRPGLDESPLHLTLELGLSALAPINTERSTIRLSGQRAENRVERWRKISRQSLKQCGRSKPVDIAPVTDLGEFLKITSQAELKIILHPHLHDVDTQSWADLLSAPSPVRRAAALVGPEGGFTEKEAVEANRAGFRLLPLGPRILRSETAAIALIAVLGFELGDLINFS